MAKETRKALAYLRTSSRANVGADKDSDKRQRAAIAAYAKAAGFEIAGEFYDAAVSGADPITDRPGFVEMGSGHESALYDPFARTNGELMRPELNSHFAGV